MISFLAVIVVLTAAVVAVGATRQPAPVDIDRMVEALRMVENWDRKSRGAAGERGFWQITPAVWAHHTDQPFSYADLTTPFYSSLQRVVARSHVVWIQRRLIEARMDVSPYDIALVWGAGWDCVFYRQPHPPSKAKKDYAQRATNLYFDLKSKSP